MAQVKLVLEDRPLALKTRQEYRLFVDQRFKWWERQKPEKKTEKKTPIFYFS